MPQSLRLYALSKMLNGAMPNEGGILDQDPRLLEEWLIIASVEGEQNKASTENKEVARLKHRTSNNPAVNNKSVHRIPDRFQRYHK